MSKENVEAVRAMMEAYDRGDFETCFDYIDSEVEWGPAGRLAQISGEETVHGHDGVREFFRQWLGTWEDYSLSVERYVEAGQRVVVLQIERGRGKVSSVPVERKLASIYDLDEGKVKRMRGYDSWEEALEAVGLSE
jgi:uncharacterized protein